MFLDKQSITADPYHPDRAWATWIQGNLPGENISFNKLVHAFSYRGTPMVSRTTDGGDTWTAPAKMTNANEYAQGNQIVVEPDGTLVDIQAILFKGSGIQPNNNGVYMAVMRSKDGGRTWSAPSKIAKLGTVAESADGDALRVGDYLPDLAVDRNSGALYATWADGLGGSTNKIVLSRSTDGGQHWSTPVIVSHHDSAQSFNHAVEVANDGEVAVLYYDDNDNTAAPGIPTDVYLRHRATAARPGAAPQKLASFDFANAPIARGHFVGDYQGLAAIGAARPAGVLRRRGRDRRLGRRGVDQARGLTNQGSVQGPPPMSGHGCGARLQPCTQRFIATSPPRSPRSRSGERHDAHDPLGRPPAHGRRAPDRFRDSP